MTKKNAAPDGSGSKMWQWSQPNPDAEGVSGDLSSHFKNAEVKRPGIFTIGHPGDTETLLAREAIQNSWDAAIEQAKESNKRPELEIKFEFLTITKDAKRDFAAALGLDEMVDQAQAAGSWHEVVGSTDKRMSSLSNNADELKILKITETGTTGMGGPWKSDYSKMYLALITVGYTMKQDGSGGSFGLGKAGLLRASRSRTVVAYSCFNEHPEDPGITRRLMGINYWKPHKIDDESYTGWGRFGDQPKGRKAQPFTNDDADRVAESLGIEVREGDLGTTFLLIEPDVEPDNLLEAIERNWWPAIVDQDGFDPTIIDYDGTELFPKPKNRENLQAFIRCYELSKTGGEGKNEDERFHRLNKKRLQNQGGTEVEQGRIALIADREDWTWPHGNETDDEVSHKSLVALIRSPRMIVEYLDAGRGAPFVRGVFRAEDEINELLRQTEPPLHDAWNKNQNEEGTDSDAPAVAKSVIDGIRRYVDKFRHDLRPPTADRKKMRLPELEKHWKQLFKGGRDIDPPPPPPPSEISISAPRQAIEISAVKGGDSKIRMSAPVSVSLTENFPENVLKVAVNIEYRFVEDQRSGSAPDSKCPLSATKLPEGFKQHPRKTSTYIGELKKDASAVTFRMESDPYDPDYAARLVVTAERLTAELEQALANYGQTSSKTKDAPAKEPTVDAKELS